MNDFTFHRLAIQSGCVQSRALPPLYDSITEKAGVIRRGPVITFAGERRGSDTLRAVGAERDCTILPAGFLGWRYPSKFDGVTPDCTEPCRISDRTACIFFGCFTGNVPVSCPHENIILFALRKGIACFGISPRQPEHTWKLICVSNLRKPKKIWKKQAQVEALSKSQFHHGKQSTGCSEKSGSTREIGEAHRVSVVQKDISQETDLRSSRQLQIKTVGGVALPALSFSRTRRICLTDLALTCNSIPAVCGLTRLARGSGAPPSRLITAPPQQPTDGSPFQRSEPRRMTI